MALASATLKTEILKLVDPNDVAFVGHPADVAGAAANWATAYDNYALNAVDFSGDAVSIVNKALFQSTLASQLASSTTAATAAAAFGAAWLAYWTGAVFSVGTPPVSAPPCLNVGGTLIFSVEATSVVAPAPIPAGLITLLTTEFGVKTEDPDAKATALANAFHTATTTAIFVLISGSDTTLPVPVPITNTCTVF